MGNEIRIPRVVISSLYPALSKVILKTAELPALGDVVSSIYQLFVHIISPFPYFMCIYLQYRINKQGNSPQFSVITVDRLKHLITA